MDVEDKESSGSPKMYEEAELEAAVWAPATALPFQTASLYRHHLKAKNLHRLSHIIVYHILNHLVNFFLGDMLLKSYRRIRRLEIY